AGALILEEREGQPASVERPYVGSDVRTRRRSQELDLTGAAGRNFSAPLRRALGEREGRGREDQRCRAARVQRCRPGALQLRWNRRGRRRGRGEGGRRRHVVVPAPGENQGQKADTSQGELESR